LAISARRNREISTEWVAGGVITGWAHIRPDVAAFCAELAITSSRSVGVGVADHQG
jgi:hypothetical protein